MLSKPQAGQPSRVAPVDTSWLPELPPPSPKPDTPARSPLQHPDCTPNPLTPLQPLATASASPAVTQVRALASFANLRESVEPLFRTVRTLLCSAGGPSDTCGESEESEAKRGCCQLTKSLPSCPRLGALSEDSVGGRGYKAVVRAVILFHWRWCNRLHTVGDAICTGFFSSSLHKYSKRSSCVALEVEVSVRSFAECLSVFPGAQEPGAEPRATGGDSNRAW